MENGEGYSDDEFDVDEDALDDLGTGRSRSPDGAREGQDADDARRGRSAASNYDPPPSLGFSNIPRTIVNTVAKTRLDQLKMLRRDCKINAAQMDLYAKQYCRPEVVNVALSMEATDPSMTDGFDKLVFALSLATPFARMGEQTGPQQSAKSAERSPVVIDAERRAEAARKR